MNTRIEQFSVSGSLSTTWPSRHSAETTGALPQTFCTVAETELIDRVRRGDSSAFYELVRPNEKVLFVSARSILKNDADAEDCAQEAILKAFKHIGGFRGDCRFSTWLVSIVINEARMRLRKNRWTESIDEVDDEGNSVVRDCADPRPLQLDVVLNDQLRAALQDAIAGLSPIYREVFAMRDINQMSIAETAEALKITEATVKVRLLRARLKLRRAMLDRGFGTSRPL